MTSAFELSILDTLDDEELLKVYDAAQRILASRSEAVLPALALEAVKEACAEDKPAAHTPVSLEFATTEWDDGSFSWDEYEVTITLVDGSTRTLDLSGHGQLRDALANHSSWNDDIDKDSTLTVSSERVKVDI
jgi:hypothetical protein